MFELTEKQVNKIKDRIDETIDIYIGELVLEAENPFNNAEHDKQWADFVHLKVLHIMKQEIVKQIRFCSGELTKKIIKKTQR